VIDEKIDKNDSVTTKLQKTENPLDTLLNSNSYLILGNKHAIVKVVDKNEVENYPTFEVLTGYRNDVIIGENIGYENLKIYKKYRPKTTFEDYPIEIYKGELTDPDFSTDPDARNFATRIKNECAKGINFAGHYTLVIWGCGSPCQSRVVVDRKTGKIYSGYGTSLGSKFKMDSKMIISNVGAIDTMTNLIELCAYCEVNHQI
jgi:hypothetical protein